MFLIFVIKFEVIVAYYLGSLPSWKRRPILEYSLQSGVRNYLYLVAWRQKKSVGGIGAYCELLWVKERKKCVLGEIERVSCLRIQHFLFIGWKWAFIIIFFVKTHTTQYAELKKKKQYNWDILEKQYLIITMLCNFSKGKTWHSVNNINCTLVGFLPAVQLLWKECFVAC